MYNTSSMRLKEHRIGYLVERLVDEGVLDSINPIYARNTLQRWIKFGWIKFRMRPPGMQYTVNDKEIEQIIINFSPGGCGCWEPYKKYPVSKAPEVALESEGQDTEVTEGRSPFAVFDDSPDNGGFTPFSVKPQGSLAY